MYNRWNGGQRVPPIGERRYEDTMRLPYPQWTNYECQRKYGGGYGGWLSYYHYPNGGYYGNHHHKSFGNYCRVSLTPCYLSSLVWENELSADWRLRGFGTNNRETVFKKLQTIFLWKLFKICAQTGIEGEAVSEQIRENMNYWNIFKYTRESGMVVREKWSVLRDFRCFIRGIGL